MDHLSQASSRSLKAAKFWKTVSSKTKHTRCVVNEVNVQKHQCDPLVFQVRSIFLSSPCLSHICFICHCTYLMICLPLQRALRSATHYSALLCCSVYCISSVTQCCALISDVWTSRLPFTPLKVEQICVKLRLSLRCKFKF